MADIELLKKKLQGLSDKIKTKDALGKDYKKIVSDSLARIKAKITKILTDHNKQVQDITRGSAENLDKTRAELAAQQARLKQASDAALEAAKRNQDKLQNNLDDTNKQLNDLQSELNKPNPDTQSMQVIIEKLRQDLQSAQNDSAASNAQIAQLTERLRAYDGVREKMDELVKNLLAKIGDILAQVDAMSINQGDITELLRLLNETEDMFPKEPPGNDEGGGGIFGNLFGGPSGTGAGAESPVKPGNYPTGPLYLKGNQPFIPKNGGKTKRRHGKKTMYRGGYIEKLRAKKSRKRSQTSKRRSGRRSTASSSSSSASSNAKQKSMQGRKM
jgi:hypothetical protein